MLYILENGLEDEEILDVNGNPAVMMSMEEAAEKFKVPIATVTAWLGSGKLESFFIGGTHYIPKNAENPNKWMSKKVEKARGPVMKLDPNANSKLVNAVEGMMHEVQ